MRSSQSLAYPAVSWGGHPARLSNPGEAFTGKMPAPLPKLRARHTSPRCALSHAPPKALKAQNNLAQANALGQPDLPRPTPSLRAKRGNLNNQSARLHFLTTDKH